MKIFSPSITGSTGILGSLDVTNGITGSLFGTASFATSASFASNVGLVSSTGTNSLRSAQFLTATAATASGNQSIAIGNNAKATSESVVVIGTSVRNDEFTVNGVAIGRDARVAEAGVAIGFDVTSSLSSVAIGPTSKARGQASVAIGSEALARQAFSIAIGDRANATGSDNVAIGSLSLAGAGAVALGASAIANFEKAVAIGTGAEAAANNSIAIGGDNLGDKVTAGSAFGINIGNRFFFNSGSSSDIELRADTSISGSLRVAGNTTVTGSLTVTEGVFVNKSVRGSVSSLLIGSNTASIDLSTGNFFDLTIVSGSDTFIDFTNILAGQTVNLKVNQPNPGNGTVSFPPAVKQVSGSPYVPTIGAGGTDIVTFISFDTSSLFLSNVKNFI